MPRTTEKKPVYELEVDLFEVNDCSVYLGHGPLPIQGYNRIQKTEATTFPGALGNVFTRLGLPRYAQHELSKKPYIDRCVRRAPQQLELPLLLADLIMQD